MTDIETLKNRTFILYRESLVQSIVADIFSMGLLILLVYLNKTYLGDKVYFDIFAMFLFFIKVLAHSRKETTFVDKQKLKDYVNSL